MAPFLLTAGGRRLEPCTAHHLFNALPLDRLPPSLLIENASDRNPRSAPKVCPEAFPIKASDASGVGIIGRRWCHTGSSVDHTFPSMRAAALRHMLCRSGMLIGLGAGDEPQVPVSLSGPGRLKAARLYRLHHVSACSQPKRRADEVLDQSVERLGAIIVQVAVHQHKKSLGWQALVGVSQMLPRDSTNVAEQNDIASSRQTLADVPHKRADLAKGPNVSKDPAFVALS